MDKRLKAKWVEALVSGKYQQGNGLLRDASTGGYCCLGVLCEVAGARPYQIEATTFPWHAGFKGLVHQDIAYELADMNDDGVPFEMIAGFINEAV